MPILVKVEILLNDFHLAQIPTWTKFAFHILLTLTTTYLITLTYVSTTVRFLNFIRGLFKKKQQISKIQESKKEAKQEKPDSSEKSEKVEKPEKEEKIAKH